MPNNFLISLISALAPYKAFLMKFLMLFSWLTSLFSLWVMARFYHQKSIPSFPEGLLITCIFLVFIFWSIYWIFAFSERFEDDKKEYEQASLSSTESIVEDNEQNAFSKANDALQESLERELITSEEQTDMETREIFSKTEKIKVDPEVYARLMELKRKTHTRVLQARHTEILAIAQLHQDIINTIDQSEYLSNIEKAEMYPDIHQFITSDTFNRWVIKT